jgi:hypothetical protein
MSMTDGDDRDLARLLADPSMWFDPDPTLEDRIIGLIRLEAAAPPVVPQRPRPRRIISHVATGMLGAAAAAAIALLVVRAPSDDPTASDVSLPTSTIQLLGTDVAAGLVGSAEVSTEQSGTLIRLRLPGLPRLDGDEFYEGWLLSCDGLRWVPIGTFHDMDRAAGWAGVSVDDYPVLNVTSEWAAGPDDSEQGSSGDVVASATIAPCNDEP